MQISSRMVSTMPPPKPLIRPRVMERSVSIQQIRMQEEGGISEEREAEVAMQASALERSYPPLFRLGSAMRENTTHPAVGLPEQEPKMVLATTTVLSRPPRKLPSQLWVAVNVPSAMPVLARSTPMKANSGSSANVYDAAVENGP